MHTHIQFPYIYFLNIYIYIYLYIYCHGHLSSWIIEKSDLSDKIIFHSCHSVSATALMHHKMISKRMYKKLEWNYIRIQRTVLNKSWKQHATQQQLYSHLLPISKTIQLRWTRHAGHCWRKDQFLCDVFSEPLHIETPVPVDQQELTCISFVGTLDVVRRTCREQWMIVMDEEREGEGEEILAVSLTWLYIYIYIYIPLRVLILVFIITYEMTDQFYDIHSCHSLFDQDGHQDNSTTSL